VSQFEDRPTFLSVGDTDYSTDDLVEINLRKGLFGEKGPPRTQIIGGTFRNPLPDLQGLKPPDEIIRSLVRLVLTEALVGSGQTAAVTRLLLSQPHDGEHTLLLEWKPRGKPDSKLRKIEGSVAR
jgi:hypothetical protein